MLTRKASKTSNRLRDRFDNVTIAFHWLSVLLVVVQLASGWWVERGDTYAATLLWLHRSSGAMFFVIVVLRILWRLGKGARVGHPSHMPVWQQYAAQGNAYALYAILLVQLGTGMGDVLFRGKAFTLFTVSVPALVERDKVAHLMLHAIHAVSAWCLLALIVMHVAAAAYHGIILRDGVVQKMLPGRSDPVG